MRGRKFHQFCCKLVSYIQRGHGDFLKCKGDFCTNGNCKIFSCMEISSNNIAYKRGGYHPRGLKDWNPLYGVESFRLLHVF